MSASSLTLTRIVSAVALAVSVLPAAASGTVEVSWLQPERYSDAGRSVADRERTMKSLGEYFTQLGRQLPDRQTLKLEVLDVDLAGEVEPYGWHEVRILRGRADWPRMTLRYTLQDGEQTLKADEAQLSDMNYFAFQHGLGMHGADLAYEKRMIGQWFGENFAAD
ncbi:MAG: DUF3016 domain-containing protein [Rubrivivax sp.]|nr:DUF3016 domain-containing protein [Rubrivivax sp.]